MNRSMLKAMEEMTQPPCEKGCSRFKECAAKLISCEAFARYVETGRSITRAHDDIPNPQLFARLSRA